MSTDFEARYGRMLASIDALEAHVMFPSEATRQALSEAYQAARVDLEYLAQRLHKGES